MIVSVHAVSAPDSNALATSPSITENIITLAWHPGGRWLAVPDYSTAVHWMDAQSGEIGLMGHHKFSAVQAVFSPDGDYLFTGGWEKEIICWEARTKRRAFNIRLNSDNIQFSADGRRCALLTPSSAQLHYFERPAAHRALPEDLGGLLRQATFSPDGRWLAAAGDKRVGLWDLTSAGPGAVLDEASNLILFFTPDGQEMFATRNPQGTPACFRWKITPAANATAPPTLTRLPLTKPRGFTSLSVRSNFVVMTGTNGSRVIDLSEGKDASERWTSTHAGINGVSPDGRWLGIYQSFGTALYVYRLPRLERVAKLTHPASISDFRFSPLGNEVAIGSYRNPPGRVEFWNTATWERTRVLTNFGRLLYTPDTRALWLTKDQRTAGLYDAHTAQPLLPLPPNTLPLALSPNGRQLAVSVDARRVQVWDLAEVRQELRALGLDWDSKQ
jgi:WD40 repeat protein